MLIYKNADAAVQLFSSSSPEAAAILGEAVPALATGGDYKVLLVQPENQGRYSELPRDYEAPTCHNIDCSTTYVAKTLSCMN